MAKEISNRPKTAGAVFDNCEFRKEPHADSIVNYTLGQKYEGGVRNQSNILSKTRKLTEAELKDLHVAVDLDGCRVLRGVFLCKGDHKDNENHSRDEFTKEVNKPISKQPAVFISQDDYEIIEKLFTSDYEGDHNNSDYHKNRESDKVADWDDKESDSAGEEVNYINVAGHELNDREANLANRAFLLGFSVCESQYELKETMHLSISEVKRMFKV